MNKGEPVVGVLRPPNAYTAKVILPRQRSLDHPTASGVTLLGWDLVYSDSATGDVHLVMAFADGLANVVVVISFVGTEMVHTIDRLGTRDDDRIQHFDSAGFVMRLGTRDDHG